jgi:hypothetical protein
MFEKNKIFVYTKVLNDLNMPKKKNFLNFINLHQSLIIETLLIMELIGGKNDNPNYCVCVIMFQKYTNIILNVVYMDIHQLQSHYSLL